MYLYQICKHKCEALSMNTENDALSCNHDDRLVCEPGYGVCVMKEEKRKFIFDIEEPINSYIISF